MAATRYPSMTLYKQQKKITMQKISKEELMKKAGLSEADLEKVAGGTGSQCEKDALQDLDTCVNTCPRWSDDYRNCKDLCIEAYKEEVDNCIEL